MSASPTPTTKIPPGPGIIPTRGETIRSKTPRTNIDHSTTGLSKNFRHCARRNMRVDVVIHLVRRKTLAGKVHSGLALLRRARGTSVTCVPCRHPRESEDPGKKEKTRFPLSRE